MRNIRRQKNKFVYIFPITLLFYFLYNFINRGIISSYPNIMIDVLLFILSFCIFILFFSFFIFPNTEITNLLPILQRVFLFMVDKVGSINHIKNGKNVEINGNSTKNNPGLILLDSSSAAIIGKSTNFHKAVGPGVVFTAKDEIILDSIDLQIQRQLLGPLENENPYSMRQQKEQSSSSDSQVQRASETKAITRDGIEVIASFLLTFKIRSKPGEGNTPFGYNPLSVERAILGQTIDHNSNSHNEDSMGWTKLPGILVVDIWRELIQKYKLNDLFQITESKLDLCVQYVNARLAQKQYKEIDAFGNKTETQNTSKEYQFLEDRGIEFLEIQLKKIHLPPEIEDGIVNRWESSWSKITTSEKTTISRLRGQAIADGITSAQKSISELIAQNTFKLSKEGTLTTKNLISQILSSRRHQSKINPVSPEIHSNNEKKSNE